MPHSIPTSSPGGLHVAIIGTGITGINLALGLQARSISYTLYERHSSIREIGAGIGFSPNAERAMSLLDETIRTTFKQAANPNGEDYFQWVNGHNPSAELLYKLYVGKDGFQGGRRGDILEAWAKLVDERNIKYGKALEGVQETEDGVAMRFSDGSEEKADVVVGCDGIWSRVRGFVDPASGPGYTDKYCYRSLVKMEDAIKAVGEGRALTRFMYNGPNGHVITYPIGGNTLLNVLVVLSDDKPWPDGEKHTAPGSKKEVVEAFKGWNETVRSIVGLLPEEMDTWALFDMGDKPAGRYNNGRVAIAGDAAHATGPHLGAGGGMGIEDALALTVLFEAVGKKWEGQGAEERKQVVAKALQAYNDARYDRTQKIVQSTRAACALFEWETPEVMDDGPKFAAAIKPIFHNVWDYDLDDMVQKAVEALESK
ncbi:hypothetical protein OQA88_9184 [Cercophora sp. LCS_1]